MFDADATLATVDAGRVPGSWTIYRANATYFVWRGLLTGCFGLSSLAICGLLLVGLGIPRDDSGRLLDALFALSGLGSCLLSLVFFSGLRTRGRRILVLTPEGFVERKYASYWPWFAVDYEGIRSIEMSAGSTRAHEVAITLTFVTLSSSRVPWDIDLWFSPAATIARQIIQAHTTYQASAVRMRASNEAQLTRGE